MGAPTTLAMPGAQGTAAMPALTARSAEGGAAMLGRRPAAVPQIDSPHQATSDADSTACASCSAERQLSVSSADSTTSGESDASGRSRISASSSSVAGRVWSLSQDPQGCREVQRVLDEAACDADRLAVARELKGFVVKAAKHSHANHVLQRCIGLLPPKDVQFMIDELMADPAKLHQAARHRYSCRILQQLVRSCLPEQLDAMVEALLAHGVMYSGHAFASFVMQKLMQHARPEHRYRLVRLLEVNMSAVVSTIAGRRLVSVALEFASKEDARWLARAVVQIPGALITLVACRSGEFAVASVLQALCCGERKQAIECLAQVSKEHDSVLSQRAELILQDLGIDHIVIS